MGVYFGTDGIRGIANKELTCDLAYNLGRAGAYVLTKKTNHIPRIIIGMDTRISGGMLEASLIAGMCSVGAKPFSLGIIPTPAVAYLVKKYNADAGVMISASHNPVADNGIKFFNSEGYKLADSIEEEIEKIIVDMQNGKDELPMPIGALVGVPEKIESAGHDYISFLLEILEQTTFKGLKIVVDCANGAASNVAPAVFRMKNAELIPIHHKPDGININHECGSTHMGSLMETVKRHNADIGIAFDGDADRCLLVDENGEMVDGDQILSICANHYKQKNMLNKNTFVATIMSNLGLFQMGEKCDINIEQTGVGDRYVLENMLKNGYNLGGEQSGHVIFLDYNTTGDGLLTSLQILKIMSETKKSLSELNNYMTVLPQVLVNAKVSNENKMNYAQSDKVKNAITKLEEKFKNRGRVLIRPSGTEPLIRVMIEGPEIDELTEEANKLAELIISVCTVD